MLTPARCRAVALLGGAAALLRVAFVIPVFTNTVDEPFHIASGVAMWDIGRQTLGIEHPPLPRLVAALPLYVGGVRLPPDARDRTIRSEPETIERGARILFESGLSYRQILSRARLAMLVFPALALLYLYLLARWAAGEFAAMLAVVFFSFDPTLLGHSMWATTDTAACAGFLAAAYHGLRWIERPSWRRAAGAGAAVGLAVACKFTCAFVVPGLLVVMLLRWFVRRRGRYNAPARSSPSLAIGQLAAGGAVAFVMLWATYFFDVGPMSDQTAFSADSDFARLPAWVRDTPVPMPSLGLGFLRLVAHNRWGHPAYLNGEIYRFGRLSYFPEAIALKSPVTLLLGLVLSAAAVWRVPRRARLRRAAWVFVIAAVFLIVAMAGHLNIGVRHVLPAIAMFYLLAAVALVRARATGVLIVLIALAALETAAAHPDYVAYFNAIARAAGGGERFLIDSNLDWGQDVGRLAAWLHSEEAAGRPYSLRLFAYPKDQLVAHLGLDPAALTIAPSGLFAISVNVRRGLMGVRMMPDHTIQLSEDYNWLQRYPHVARVGSSIDVYDLSVEPLAGTSHQ